MTRADERAARRVVRTKLATARNVLAELGRSKAAALKEITRNCRTARRAVRDRVKAWRKLQTELLKTANYGARAEVRDRCEAQKRRAIREASDAAEGVRRAIAIEVEHLGELKRASKPVNPKRRAGGHRAEERRAEALEEIANNLPAEYLPIFQASINDPGIQRAIRRGQSGNARLSATEAVLEYIAEHPHLAWELERKHEADAIRDFERHHKTLRRMSKQKRPDLADVPF